MNHLRIHEQGPFLTSFRSPNSDSTLYYVSSRRNPEGLKSSSIYRNDPLSGSPTELADVTYLNSSTTHVKFGTKVLELDAFLRRRSTCSNSRVFVGPNGQIYKWRINGKNLELYDYSSQKTIARSHRPRSCLFSWKACPASLEISRKFFDQQTLDAVLVTFVIMERLLRDRLKYDYHAFR